MLNILLINKYVSGITFTRYVQNRKIGKSNNLKVLGATKPKGFNNIGN
jgi:hypothetical protein